jgi:hypothetical protein
LGFVFWLGQTLDSAGYTALPAKSTQAARRLIEEHRIPVDILVIDPLLADAFQFISGLKHFRHALAVVAAIPEDWDILPPMSEVDAVIRKPRRLNAVAAIQWLNLIQTLSAKFAERTPESSPTLFS